MEYIMFMMNKWCEVRKYCQFLSTISPSCIGNKETSYDTKTIFSERSDYIDLSVQFKKLDLDIRVPIIKLLLVLERHMGELLKDYQTFVEPMFQENNVFLTICVRYEFYKTICVTERLTYAICKFLENDDLITEKSSVQYFIHTLLPRKQLYHNCEREPLVASECLNYMYEFAFDEFIKNLVSPHNATSVSKKYDFEGKQWFSKKNVDVFKMEIILNNPSLNGILKWVAELFSYPVLPPNIAGKLISTKDKRQDILDLLTPSLDSKYHHKAIFEPTVCFSCKFFNLSVGQTDDTEQRDYLKCNCIFDDVEKAKNEDLNAVEPSVLDSLTILNARTMLNLLFILKDKYNKDEEFGCTCSDHQRLLHIYVEDHYKLLSKLQILNHLN